jgi:hypothetical protein
MPQDRPERALARRGAQACVERGLTNGSTMTTRKKLTGLSMIVAIAIWSAACSSKTEQSPAQSPASMQMSTAAPGSCQIDAVKMCQATGGGSQTAANQASAPMAGSYGPSNLPESVEFQIPAGQNIKLMCYYDSNHSSVYKADATPDSALTDNSVDYMKKQGFCSNK